MNPLRIPTSSPPSGDVAKPAQTSSGGLVAVVMSGILLLGLLGFVLTPRGDQKVCFDATKEVEQIEVLIRQRKFALAAELAYLQLSNRERPLCDDAKLALAGLAYQAEMSDVYTLPAAEGHKALQRWQEAERRAQANGVPKEKRSGLTVASEAYKAHLWELSRGAFLKAWDEEPESTQTREWVEFYYAIMRNFGKNAVKQKQFDQQYHLGLVLLSTACAIDKGYELNRGEACQDLVEELGQSNWPAPDAGDKVLLAAPHNQGGSGT